MVVDGHTFSKRILIHLFVALNVLLNRLRKKVNTFRDDDEILRWIDHPDLLYTRYFTFEHTHRYRKKCPSQQILVTGHSCNKIKNKNIFGFFTQN